MTFDRAILARTLPFVLFLVFIPARDLLGEHWPDLIDLRLIYPIKIALVAALLLYFARHYTELTQRPQSRAWAWLWAPLVGIGVFVLWINLDQGWMNLSEGGWHFDPRDAQSGELIWSLAIFRLAGTALVVPLMEELFWRSFIMRWIDQHDFLMLAPAAVTLKAVLVSSLVFGFEHTLWLAGILAGLAYSWIYRASGNLWPAIIAHGVTNALLGAWVLYTGSWQFW